MDEWWKGWWNGGLGVLFWEGGGPLYIVLGRSRDYSTSALYMGTHGHRLLEDKIKSPTKLHLDGSLSRVGRLRGSTGPRWSSPRPTFLWLADRWVLVLYLLCLCLGVPVSSARWALFVSEMQNRIFCVFLLCLLVFSRVFHMWVPANDNSPKLVEPVRIKPYI